jgi:hypothetical protein
MLSPDVKVKHRTLKVKARPSKANNWPHLQGFAWTQSEKLPKTAFTCSTITPGAICHLHDMHPNSFGFKWCKQQNYIHYKYDTNEL